MRTTVLSIIAAAAMCAGSAFAQPADPPSIDDQAVELMLGTWEPTTAFIIELMDGVDVSTRADQSVAMSSSPLDTTAGIVRFSSCPIIFKDNCLTAPIANKLIRSTVRVPMHDPEFLGRMDDAEMAALASAAVDFISEGTAQKILSGIQPLYTQPFDVSQGFTYQRWRQNACNYSIRSDGSTMPDWRIANNAMSDTECRQDEFTQFLRDNYCNSDACDLVNISWTYGFLVRRHIVGGEEFVSNWQQLMLTAATYSGVIASDPEVTQ